MVSCVRVTTSLSNGQHRLHIYISSSTANDRVQETSNLTIYVSVVGISEAPPG